MKAARAFPWQLLAMSMVLGSPTLAYAHVGIGHTSGFVSGLAHPLSGLDHLCAMVGAGLWAAQRGDRLIWLVPMAFVVVMALGGVLGAIGVEMPLVERGIVASVLALGILIAACVRLPLVASVLLVGTFAIFHGHAHGAEMPITASGLMYGLGFIAATAFLHLVGIGLEMSANKSGTQYLVRYAGCALILCALYLAFPG